MASSILTTARNEAISEIEAWVDGVFDATVLDENGDRPSTPAEIRANVKGFLADYLVDGVSFDLEALELYEALKA